MRARLAWFLCFSGVALTARASEIQLTNAVVIGSIGRSARETIHTDAVEARIVRGQWQTPQPGDRIAAPDGREQTWEALQANPDGWFEHRALRGGGYVCACLEVATPRIMLLEAAGHNAVYVNGEIRAGDPYGAGYVRLPVALRAGTNEFLFNVTRGRLRARLTEPKSAALFNLADMTLPDLIGGESEPVWGAVVVVNASTNALDNLFIRVTGTAQDPATRFGVGLPPLGVRKAGFQVRPPPLDQPGEVEIGLELVRAGDGEQTVWDAAALKLGVRHPTQLHKRTFVSGIDGSVQYYAVNPPTAPVVSPALVLSLHGAGVEASGQAAAYAPKPWGLIVSPTNRRPYGFDWEEWGRQDALEVLALAQRRYQPDPSRIYLTGHSMGGHGTWQLGLTYPDRFAALGPSAGWISFRTYARAGASDDTTPMQEMLRRAAASSDTLLLITNSLPLGLYLLHGETDDNVPVREARTMRDLLGPFHRDLDWHEQPGAGHWWDASDEPGTDCVDWAPLFDLFARRRIPAPAEIREVKFTTVNPAVSSRCRWLTIQAQQRPLLPSHVSARCDPGRRRIRAQTVNVRRLAFDLACLMPPGAPVSAELDGAKLEPLEWPTPRSADAAVLAPIADGASGSAAPPQGETATLVFERAGEQWVLATTTRPTDKGPARSGPFREAFRRRMLFVYATQGTPSENAWALGKARYDAETFWYRGNGSVDVIPDLDYVAAPNRFQFDADGSRRNVILYGHAQANAAWPALLAQSPVQVRRGVVRLGERELAGEDLAGLFLRPHPEDPCALVGVVSGSGLPGMRLAERLPVFLSGTGLPDCLVVGADMLTKGIEGVKAAGLFGYDWSVERGEFVWRNGDH